MDALTGIAVIGCLAAIPAGLAMLARRVRRRGTAGPAIAAAMAAYNEAMLSTAYDGFVEMRAQDDRAADATDSDPLSGEAAEGVPRRCGSSG